jgi:hypothetical protein
MSHELIPFQKLVAFPKTGTSLFLEGFFMREHAIDFASCYGALEDYEAVRFESFNLLFD